MEKKLVIAILTIAAFILAGEGGELLKFFDWFTHLERPARRTVYAVIWYILWPLAVLGLFHGIKKIGQEAGLASGAWRGIGMGLLGTLPMLFGAGILTGFNMTLHLPAILVGCLLAALGEEILYRGFLFGQLFRHAGWGFLPAGLVSAMIFGAGHLYQGSGPGELVGIFAVTLLGGLWFSWLYVEWGHNLWVPIAFHFFMNLSWTIFEVSDNALGSWAPNVFRAATIGLSVYLTIRHKKNSGEKWIVKGRRWWRDADGQEALQIIENESIDQKNTTT